MNAYCVLVLSAACFTAALHAHQSVRDGYRPSAGTGRISGVVLSDDADPTPLRRARVTLNAPELPVGRTAIAEDDGSFLFEWLPAGRYSVGADKQGYVPMQYGARRSGRPGTPVVLRDGEARAVTIRLARGAVITGTVTDEHGEPVPGIQISALTWRWIPAFGARRLSAAGFSGATLTDDLGNYRIFGLPPGEYVISARVRSSSSTVGSVHRISDAELQRALSELRSAAQPASWPGGVPAPPVRVDIVEPARAVTFARVYYPGTTVQVEAARIAVAAAAQQGGIDFQLRTVPTASVSGTVLWNAPADVYLVDTGGSQEQVQMFSTSGATGRFEFRGIPPGRYTVLARARAESSTAGQALINIPALLWASTELDVDGEDTTEIILTPQPGVSISGRLLFEHTTPHLLPTNARFMLPLGPAAIGPGPAGFPDVHMESDGRFRLTSGLAPGRYRIGNDAPGIRTPIRGWWLSSIVMDGREVLDAPIELRHSTHDVVVTFSERASDLTGRVRDERGEPAPGHTVVVFGADPASWFLNSRRVVGVQPDPQGRYSIRNLPPGAYFVTTSNEIEPGEWFDPEVLERFLKGAATVRLAKYELKQHDVIVTR